MPRYDYLLKLGLKTINIMPPLIKTLDLIIELTGRFLAWFTLFIVVITFLVVVLRYCFDIGSIALQESITYFHAFVFMLGAAYTLKHDGHVRVDIFYRKMTAIKKAWIDLLGTLLLLFPVCLFILISSWDYVFTSWSLLEESGEAGGLAYVYILKTTLLLMPLLLMVQGLVIILKNLLTIQEKAE